VLSTEAQEESSPGSTPSLPSLSCAAATSPLPRPLPEGPSETGPLHQRIAGEHPPHHGTVSPTAAHEGRPSATPLHPEKTGALELPVRNYLGDERGHGEGRDKRGWRILQLFPCPKCSTSVLPPAEGPPALSTRAGVSQSRCPPARCLALHGEKALESSTAVVMPILHPQSGSFMP